MTDPAPTATPPVAGHAYLILRRGRILEGRVLIDAEHQGFSFAPGDVTLRFHHYPEGVTDLTAEVEATARGETVTGLSAPVPHSLIKSVELLPVASCPAPVYAEAYELSDLFPLSPTPNDLPPSFVRKNRIKDRPTLRFLAEQILANDVHSPIVKVEVVKIIGYLAVEEQLADDMAWSLKLLDDALDRLQQFPTAKGTSKTHPTHIRISLLFVRTLVLVMLERWAEAIADFETVYSLRTEVVKVPIIGFNTAYSMVLYGWLLGQAGRKDEALIKLAAVIQTFRDAAEHMPAAKAKLFADLRASLDAAVFALGCCTELRTTGSLVSPAVSAERTTFRFSRLTKPSARDALAKKLLAMANTLRLPT